MEFLKRETIENIIRLAEECHKKVEGAQTYQKGDIDTDKIFNEYLPNREKMVKFIDSLNYNEKIELIALVVLGRGDKDNWLRSLEEAKNHLTMIGNYIGPKSQLVSYLRKGLDKLAKK